MLANLFDGVAFAVWNIVEFCLLLCFVCQTQSLVGTTKYGMSAFGLDSCLSSCHHFAHCAAPVFYHHYRDSKVQFGSARLKYIQATRWCTPSNRVAHVGIWLMVVGMLISGYVFNDGSGRAQLNWFPSRQGIRLSAARTSKLHGEVKVGWVYHRNKSPVSCLNETMVVNYICGRVLYNVHWDCQWHNHCNIC